MNMNAKETISDDLTKVYIAILVIVITIGKSLEFI